MTFVIITAAVVFAPCKEASRLPLTAPSPLLRWFFLSLVLPHFTIYLKISLFGLPSLEEDGDHMVRGGQEGTKRGNAPLQM